MGVRIGCLFLFLLGVSVACVDARSLMTSDVSIVQINNQEHKSKIRPSEAYTLDERVCTLCEQFTAQAICYLGQNKTQTEIIGTLHQACSIAHSLKQKCITLVDYYIHLFFLEITRIQPSDICRKVNLCDQALFTSRQKYQDSCTLCHHAVAEVLVKLKDPDTQLEIIEALLKGCGMMENYAVECKKLVFEFGPMILANANQFLETSDLCTTIHACEASANGSGEALSPVKESLLSES